MTKTYIQPEVQVAQIALASIVLAGSGTPSGDMGLSDIPTDDQW